MHADDSYLRLTKTVTIPAGASAQLQFQLSLNSETAYDHFIVEARTVGRDGAAPTGSPEPLGNWVIGPELLDFYAATATNDTLLLGFGFEHLATDAERAELMSRALNGLLE